MSPFAPFYSTQFVTFLRAAEPSCPHLGEQLGGVVDGSGVEGGVCEAGGGAHGQNLCDLGFQLLNLLVFGCHQPCTTQ